MMAIQKIRNRSVRRSGMLNCDIRLPGSHRNESLLINISIFSEYLSFFEQRVNEGHDSLIDEI